MSKSTRNTWLNISFVSLSIIWLSLMLTTTSNAGSLLTFGP
ncbi:hypothetical Protein YC6258_00543 [Gynuella sunshinyii YC6258]|uniref:Uncharacterized protein n=1 Tax=Gynuella sunshinyii YC6258 TaxID=1445510 RepID=A0A0C5VGU2_9GAMM|nr:hypothetical Protein YC6258_00543 [Gynuella sunshinyii YC6258]